MNIITKDNMSLMQREDGYINATALCKSAGKLFTDYRRMKSTEEFISCISADMGIPISAEIQAHDLYWKLKREGKENKVLMYIRK